MRLPAVPVPRNGGRPHRCVAPGGRTGGQAREPPARCCGGGVTRRMSLWLADWRPARGAHRAVRSFRTLRGGTISRYAADSPAAPGWRRKESSMGATVTAAAPEARLQGDGGNAAEAVRAGESLDGNGLTAPAGLIRASQAAAPGMVGRPRRQVLPARSAAGRPDHAGHACKGAGA